jgi:acetylornithine deacetylase/succinyl-diaminopimelate desuccinylase-like protein
MRSLALLGLLVGCGNDSPPDSPTPPVDPMSLAAQVSQSELSTSIQALEALETRFTMGPGDDNARTYLVDRLAAMGLTAELDPFTVANETANNIIVRHPGTETPNVVYIFLAHYDSTSSTAATMAPGADDNATGVSAVLEAARLLTPHAFKHSIWFVFTAAEEQGSLGSKHMVTWLVNEGLDVRGVIAPDMIGLLAARRRRPARHPRR